MATAAPASRSTTSSGRVFLYSSNSWSKRGRRSRICGAIVERSRKTILCISTPTLVNRLSEPDGLGHDRFRCDTEEAEQLAGGTRSTETAHADEATAAAEVTIPAQAHRGFDPDAND